MAGPVSFGGAENVVVPWVAERIPMPPEDFGSCAALGITLDGKSLACGVVYSEFRTAKHGNSMQATIASDQPGWASKRTLGEMFAYPFIQMGCSRLWVMVSKRNKRARRLAERLGFKYEGTGRKAWDGRIDAHVLSMLPHECQWICRA